MWEKFSPVAKFFLGLITLAKRRLGGEMTSPQEELPTSSELELGPAEVERGPAEVDTETQEQPIIDQQRHRPTVDHVKMHWPLLVIGVCFAAAGVALQALRVPKPLPMIFHYFCMALELSFVALVVSIYIRRRYEPASVVMDHVSIFLGATAFMLAIGMNFSAPFVAITGAVYFIALLIIIFANRCMP